MLFYDQKLKEKNYGFTLVEIIAVIAIIGILASLSVPKFIDLTNNSGKTILRQAVNELNSREFLVWSKIKCSDVGWLNDEALFLQMDTDLGSDYKWSPSAQSTGGILHFKEQMVKLDRTASTNTSSGSWIITNESGE